MSANGSLGNYSNSLMRSASPSGSTMSVKSATDEYANDPRYKKYVQLVEKNLQFFDAVNEWADIISFLGRLLRSFQAYPQYPVIPRKMTVAKRLAQCLNPGFPAGVHQKTLEVYAYIFETIDSHQLVEDMPLWSAGLFPFVQHAATHVKPQLLAIFEKYYFRLGAELKPTMRGLVIALLPVVEEEGSEYFDKGISLLDHLGRIVDLPFVNSCIWLVLINNASLRLAALNYLLRRLPKLDNPEDIAAVLGGSEHTTLMVRGFAATLSDSHILVQRNMLELLVQNFPLNAKILSHNDRLVIMKAAAGVVLRKDMSLNRRLYAWLLGPEESSRAQLSYMLAHAHQPFIQAINALFMESITHQQDGHDHATYDQQRPYRILVSLMDKWEVGQPVLDKIFLDVVRCLKKESQLAEFATEVRHTANMWLDMVDPYLVWSKLFALMDTRYPGKVMTGEPESSGYKQELDDLKLILFLLQTFKMADEEIQQMHLPLFLAATVRKLEEAATQANFSYMIAKSDVLVNIIVTILHQIAPSALQDRRPSKLNLDSQAETEARTEEYKTFTSGDSLINYARNYYGIQPGKGDKRASLFAEEDEANKEDSGDMSMASLPKSISDSSIAMYNTPQPKYDPVRGSVLLNELLDGIASFLTRLIESNVLRPEQPLRKATSASEPIPSALSYQHLFRCTCEILRLVVARANATDIKQCTDALIKCSSNGPDFTFVSASLETLLDIADSPSQLKSSFWEPKLVKAMIDKLWGYLSTDSPFYHNRTVELIWHITDQARPHQVESIVCSYLVDTDLSRRTDAYARFGLFWRLSDDERASVVFAKPMFVMLDLIRDHSTIAERRAGETWIRCHLRSYTRVLEPIITSLLDKRIVWRDSKYTVVTKFEDDEQKYDIPYFVYARPFDWDISNYMYETLLVLVKFGGHGALRSFANHYILPSGHISDILFEKLSISAFEPTADGSEFGLTYLDALIAISLRYLQSEPSETLSANAKIVNSSIQGYAAELLMEIVTHVDFIDINTVATIHTTCLQKLLYCIHTGKLDTQTRLLHIVHSTLSILATFISSSVKGTASNAEKSLRRKLQVESALSDPMGQFDGYSAFRNATGATISAPAMPLAISKDKSHMDSDVLLNSSSLFIQCVTDGFSTLSNRPVLQHWMDFWLTSLPNLRGCFRDIILPLLICICDQTTACRNQFDQLAHSHLSSNATPSFGNIELPDSYILMFLNGIEKMVMFCLLDKNVSNSWQPGHGKTPSGSSSTTSSSAHKSGDMSALRGFALLLYGDDVSNSKDQTSEEHKARDTILFHLPTILQVLVEVWDTFDVSKVDLDSNDTSAAGYRAASQRVHSRLEKTLERLYRSHSPDTVEACVELFFTSNPAALEFEMTADQKMSTVIFDFMLSAPSGKPQHVLPLLLDGIRARSSGMYMSRPRTILRTGKLTDTSLIRFAEIYCDTVVTPEELGGMWPLIQSFSKDYLSQTSASMKVFIPALLRFLTTVQEKSYDSSTVEERRVRKETQDNYQRVIDYCILIAGRSFDQGIWLRRTNVYEKEENSVSTDKLSVHEAATTDMGRSISANTVSDLEKRTGWKTREDTMIEQINMYIANSVIPKLKHLIVDQDRINSLLNNLVYYVIGPALKTKPSLSKMAVLIDQIYEMAKLPFTYRTWRKEIWDVFLDSRFFYMSASTAQKWRTIIQTIMTAEKERFVEVVNRISTSPSTALFSNREQEALTRAINLRRLTFIIFSGTTDQFISQLPIIQEKLVELLKLNHNELIHVEIYLCLRVMLTRFSQRHLTNFWPVILTEMMRLFNSFLNNDITDKPEEAQIALAGCKFLDLLCTLETDTFQIYQWIFIVDDIDALLQKRDPPTTIIERFALKLASSSTSVETSSYAEQSNLYNSSINPSNGERKRPMLTMRNIGSVHQLEFFVNHISLYVYQANLSLTPPDMAFIEGLLQNDLLEGDMD